MNLTTEQLKRLCNLLELVNEIYGVGGISTDRAIDLIETAVVWHARKEKELREELQRFSRKPEEDK
jgi:hypothetical protein